MKYMGSKSALLRGALGEVLLEQCESSDRFIDLFAGAGSVSHFVAENAEIPVISSDLQLYSRYLVGAITERDAPIVANQILDDWITPVVDALSCDDVYGKLQKIDLNKKLTKSEVLKARRECAKHNDEGFIVKHYGGHYFSPRQAFVLDRLYSALPAEGNNRTLCMAVLIGVSSKCAAAPGHTAQPFQPTPNLLPYIRTAWIRDVIDECKRSVIDMAPRHANVAGRAYVSDAQSLVSKLGSRDLVFCDPPYSAVQYSRFYHVLEGIARGGWESVTGKGRAPRIELRSSSDFSMTSQAKLAMKDLLDRLYEKSCRVIVTFPESQASNGLSGKEIVELAKENWDVTELSVDSTHSTMGGSSAEGGRGGRRKLQESVLILDPKSLLTPIDDFPGPLDLNVTLLNS